MTFRQTSLVQGEWVQRFCVSGGTYGAKMARMWHPSGTNLGLNVQHLLQKRFAAIARFASGDWLKNRSFWVAILSWEIGLRVLSVSSLAETSWQRDARRRVNSVRSAPSRAVRANA